MKKTLLFAFIILISYSPFYSFAQNQAVVQNDLPDKTPRARSGTPSKAGASIAIPPKALPLGTLDKAGVDNNKPVINKSKLLDTGNNILEHTNELVKALLGTDKLKSLMFDDKELSNIDRAIDSYRNKQTFSVKEDGALKKEEVKEVVKENEKSYIYLASIIYYSDKEWALWIDSTKITSDDNQAGKELFVKEIYQDRARIVWSLSASKWRILSNASSEKSPPKLNSKNIVEIEFTLKPNQTFILSSGKIAEGRAVSTLAKDKEVLKEQETKDNINK